jgi:chromate transporter
VAIQDRGTSPRRGSAVEVARVFGVLGVRAFGGPAVHVALMRREVVERRHWLDGNDFDALFAACSLIPGPGSTQLALVLGLRRAGWRGMAVAAACFIAPSVAVMIGLAALYSATGGGIGRARGALLGAEAAVVAIVAAAALELAAAPVRRWDTAAVLVAALALGTLHVTPLAVLAGGALVVGAARGLGRSLAALLVTAVGHQPVLAVVAGSGRLLPLALTFLKIGAVAFGSGYVLLPFLHADLATPMWHLSDRQIADGFAASQATPGPVFGVAGFLGYLVGGVPAGLVAAAAIFAPSFVLVPLLDRIVAVVSRRAVLSAALAGVAAAAVGLIAGSDVDLARAAWSSPLEIAISAVCLLILQRWRLAQPWAVLAGIVAGGALHALHG